MRGFVITCLGLCALALPAAAYSVDSAAGDGTLVVKAGSAPAKVAVVTLVISGTAIGHVSTGSPDQVDTVVIDDQTYPNGTGDIGASGTNGAFLSKTSVSATRTKLVGADFRFRAANGVYKIWVYGSGADVFAVGTGRVVLQGTPGSAADGKYSLNGGDWHSLPAQPTDWLPITDG
jgi:hypothetical protein